MKLTLNWLNDHLKTKKSEQQIIEKLNGIGLEVEKVEPIKNELSDFIKLTECNFMYVSQSTYCFWAYLISNKLNKCKVINLNNWNFKNIMACR